ncbi:MAG: hypothetical protein ACYDAR_17930 [Thermomicrobiales bacterium]
MAMRPMMNDQRAITRADLTVVSALFAVAVLLVILAQVLGFNLL